MSTIFPLAAFLAFNQAGTKLPDFYTEYTSQEDRLNEIAIFVQRFIKYVEVINVTINDVIQAVNDTGAVDVSNLIQELSATKADLDALESLVATLDTKQTQTAADVAQLKTSTAATAASLQTVITSLQAVSTDVANLKTGQTSTNGRVTALETSTNTLRTDVNSLNTTVGALSTSVTQLGSRVATLESNANTNEVRVSNLEDRATDLESRADSSDTRANSFDSRLDSLENGSGGGGSDPALSARVANVENEVGEIQPRVATAEDNIENADGRIQNIEKRYYVDGSGLSTGESGPGTEIRYSASIGHMASDEQAYQKSIIKLRNDEADNGDGFISIQPGQTTVDAEGNTTYEIVFSLSEAWLDYYFNDQDRIFEELTPLSDEKLNNEELNQTNTELKAEIAALEARVAELESSNSSSTQSSSAMTSRMATFEDSQNSRTSALETTASDMKSEVSTVKKTRVVKDVAPQPVAATGNGVALRTAKSTSQIDGNQATDQNVDVPFFSSDGNIIITRAQHPTTGVWGFDFKLKSGISIKL